METINRGRPSGWWRRRAWWARYLAYAGAFLFLLAATYVFFDVRGRMRWQAHVAAIEAAGGSLELRDLIRHPATEESFWNDAFVQGLVRGDYPALEEPKETLEALDPGIDLHKYYYQRRGWTQSNQALLDCFPGETLTRSESATRLLAALSNLDKELDQLAAASTKPASAWPWITFEAEELIETCKFCHLGGSVRTLVLRGICRLEANDAEGALADALSLQALTLHIQHEGLLIDALTASDTNNRGLQILWEGLERRAWKEAELARLDQSLLESLDSWPDLRDLLARERAFGLAYFRSEAFSFPDRWRHFGSIIGGNYQPLIAMPDWVSSRLPSLGGHPWGHDPLNRFLLAATPQGVLLENVIFRDRLHESTLLNPSLTPAQRIGAELDAIRAIFSPRVRNPFSVLNTSEFARVLLLSLDTRQWLAIVRVAVAAERHRLARGEYPETWGDLVPEWLPAIPEDIWTSGSLIYRLDPDDRPMIYSVGRDETDDGGIPEKDLVWRYTPPPEPPTTSP